MDDQATRLYESRALLETDWWAQQDGLLAADWEYRPPLAGVVYIRKHVAGGRNDNPGWLDG